MCCSTFNAQVCCGMWPPHPSFPQNHHLAQTKITLFLCYCMRSQGIVGGQVVFLWHTAAMSGWYYDQGKFGNNCPRLLEIRISLSTYETFSVQCSNFLLSTAKLYPHHTDFKCIVLNCIGLKIVTNENKTLHSFDQT